MIRRLRGKVIEKQGRNLVLDVQGVGYLLQVTPQVVPPADGLLDVHVHTHMREASLQLYGFANDLEREAFELLLTVPSVGPAKAMGILETSVVELCRLIREGELARLAKLPGVGKKTAERLVVDLRDKMEALRARLSVEDQTQDAQGGLQADRLADLVSALVNLGFKPVLAEKAALKALKSAPEAKFEDLLRRSLAEAS